MSRYDILFEPVQVGPKTAPNRFWLTPHATGYGVDYPDMQASYRRIKAEGGWGVVFTEATSVAPESDKGPYMWGRAWDDHDVANLRHTVEQVHAEGALAGIELEYHSSMSVAAEGRLVAHGVDTIAGGGTLPIGYAGTPAVLGGDDLVRIQDLHVQAALRAVDAGFDLVTFHCGHGASLFTHFLIPHFNTRTDEYNGSLENRARFARETMTKVRAAVGDRAAVGLRFGVDTLDGPLGLGDRGIRHDGDAAAFMQHMDDLVDYWDLIIGASWDPDTPSSRQARENHEAPFTGDMKQHTTKPVVNVGRFNGPDTMATAVKSGQTDFIGAARAAISDPFLPAKIRDGAIDDIRECIGCNMCVSRINMWNGRIVCTQNATIGEEFRRGWHPEKYTEAANREQAVLVVGAGPAGLECATVLGKRGFEAVHLIDGADEVGGCLNWVTKLPGRQEWRHVIEYRELQLSKLKNVTTILGTRMSVDDVLEYGAQTVIVATGSHYVADGRSPYTRQPLPIADTFAGSILTPEQVVSGEGTIGERVLVWDTDGYFVGPGIAELLASQGHQVTAATPAAAFGSYLGYTMEHTVLTHDLRAAGVNIYPNAGLMTVDGNTAEIATLAGNVDLEVDTVVVVNQRVSDSELYTGLLERRDEWEDAGLENVFHIGDAVRPSFIADAIFAGHRLGREIDTDDPTTAQPYIRERRVVGTTDVDFAHPRKLLPLA